MEKGIIYIVVGDIKYLKEAVFSAKSLKRFCPDLPATLFANHTVTDSCFDQVIHIDNDINPFKNKVKYLCQSPYEQTLFLDSDTQIKAPIYELLNILDTRDIALTSFPSIDRNYFPAKLVSYEQSNADNTGVLYNTGVISYKSSDSTKRFFEQWLDQVMQQDSEQMRAGNYCDQFYFNQLIEKGIAQRCQLNIGLLPNKLYNVRPPMIAPMTKTGEISAAKILHCHDLHKNFLERQAIRLSKRFKRDFLASAK